MMFYYQECISDIGPFLSESIKFFDVEEMCNVQDSIVILDYYYVNYPQSYIEKLNFIVKERNKKGFNTILIIDRTCEPSESDIKIIEILSSIYVNLGINKQNIIFAINKNIHDLPENFNFFYFDGLLADAGKVLKENSLLFSTTPIKDRPKKINVWLSKLKSRSSRVKTLYYFYKQGLLEKSLIGALGTVDDCMKIIEDKNFISSIEKYLKPFDGTPVVESALEAGLSVSISGSKNTIKSVYDNSSLGYINETSDYGFLYKNFITEKTYRTIMNRQPFVMQSSPQALEYLRSMGFQTFNSIIDESYDQDPSENIEHRVIVAKNFLDSIDQHIDEIQEIVEFNYKKLQELSTNEIKKVNNIYDYFNRTC